jgi:diguanylate cyclase (GGDEF)-like protein/PAS domain S-box-containing protein
MKQKERRKVRFPFSTALPLFLIGCGWYAVLNQSHSLEVSTVETYQKAQLEVVRSTARAARTYISRQLEYPQPGTSASTQIEQEVLDLFIKPARLGTAGDAWIYSPNYFIFSSNRDLPKEYQGKSMALMFALQRQHGVWHYEDMMQTVVQEQEGVGWYVWQPDRAKPFTPWWEWLTQDAGREIAVWTPVKVFPDTERQKVWIIGISALLPELMQMNGAYAQIQNSIITMSIVTVAVLTLMTVLRRSRLALEASESYYRAIVEDQMEMICRFRCDGALTFVNQAYANTFGITSTNLKGANVFDLIPQRELPTVLLQLSSLSAAYPVYVSERLIKTADGELRWQQWTDRAILSSRGQVVEIQSVGRDITSRKLYETEIERLAFTDSLTGLANRRRLYHLGENTLSNRASQAATALIYLDLDRFKPINDTMGHDAGDELLIQVVERLQACIRACDLLARLGGDEFAILLTASSLTEAKQIAERIAAALKQPFQLRGQEIQLGCSIGIASAASNLSFSQLLTQADIAMYRAKSQGRGTCVVFDAAMHAEALSRRKLEMEMRQVIEQEQLRVHYQPIVSLSSYRLLGFEAVVRWQHPERGLLTPADFLLIAEEVGFSLTIERWVMQQACRQIMHWHRHSTNAHLMVSINLSSKHLACPNLIGYLELLLQETGLPSRRLMLEITEDVVIQHTDLAIATLTQLRQLGVQIGLDDFGTGYSSLSYLHRFPVDMLKIDHSFIQDMSQDNKNAEIVRSIATLAHSLDIRTIAEGIETIDQLAQLRALRCSYGQGYFFAEPLSQFAVEHFLKRYNHERLRTVN